MMNVSEMSAEEKKWRMRNDARTLAEAQEIIADKERHADAVKAAQQMVADNMKKFNAMKKVAGTKVSSESVRVGGKNANDIFRESVNKARW